MEEKHLTILSPKEVDELYGLPALDELQREEYFHLDEPERLAMFSLRGLPAKVYFILQHGYFKAKQQFYIFTFAEVQSDVVAVLRTHFAEEYSSALVKDLEENVSSVSKPTRLTQQKMILTLTGYQSTTPAIRKLLLDKAQYLARIHSKPIYIFRELVHFLHHRRIVLPGYSVLQQHIVSKALVRERTRIEQLLNRHVSAQEMTLLDVLLEKEDNDQTSSQPYYRLTYLQQEPANFNYQAMREQVKRKTLLQPVYDIATRVLPLLDLSHENIYYYGSLAHYYTIYKLKQFQSNIIHLYLLCFAYSRWQLINDILIEAFQYHVRDFTDKAKTYAKDQVAGYHLAANAQLRKVPHLLRLFTDSAISDDTTFGEVRRRALSIIGAEDIDLVSQYIERHRLDDKALQWSYYDLNKRKLGYTMRYLFTHLHFEGTRTNSPFVQAIQLMQEVFQSGRRLGQIDSNLLPTEFVSRRLRRYLYDGLSDKPHQLNTVRYEVFVYHTLTHRLESGDIFVPDSGEHRSFDQDLIPVEQWKNKPDLLRKLDFPRLLKPIDQLLDEWEEAIGELYQVVNRRIRQKDDQDIRVTEQGNTLKWQLTYQEDEEASNHQVYRQFTPIHITSLLPLVDQHTNFLSAFTHILPQRGRKKSDPQYLLASILALATNHGFKRMAEISDLNYHELVSMTNNYLRVETLRAANDRVVNATARLSMYEHFHIQPNTVHSSSDGQKYETQFETINSRYSSKYFGLSKGVTSYTMVANHIPVNAKIIGANEHESHYVFDLLFNNSSDVQSQIHSTDTHGTNQVNFAILDLFGYQFAPRYKQISSRAKMIYSFRHPIHYEDELLKPVRMIRRLSVEDEWDNVQRIMASLALKRTTQSTIIRKLSSYSRTNKTKQALWEYDNIVRTEYILRYLNSRQLRRNVQKALNRGESYHSLRKHIAYVNQGKFRVHSVQEQQVWSECTRLVANCMVYYNTYLLSELLQQKQKQFEERSMGQRPTNQVKDVSIEDDQQSLKEAIKAIKQVSPIAWRHIHIYGTYRFLKQDELISWEEVIKSVKL
ncbi:MAG: Tn3 family transposase [Cyclobacteriaceae bacterium]